MRTAQRSEKNSLDQFILSLELKYIAVSLEFNKTFLRL